MSHAEEDDRSRMTHDLRQVQHDRLRTTDHERERGVDQGRLAAGYSE